MEREPFRVMFTYWGRRGLTQFALQLARVALADHSMVATISVSRQNEAFQQFEDLGLALLPVDTFRLNAGAFVQSWRIPLMRKHLIKRIRRDRIAAVIDLMPHVWSTFMVPAIKACGARYVALAHDADTHAGDYRSFMAKGLTNRAIRQADLVLTLSQAVTDRLVAKELARCDRTFTLFHPDLDFSEPRSRFPPKPGEPLRLIFMGRVMPYKGLPNFIDAVELLRKEGIPVEVGVFGEGYLGNSAPRLQALSAVVVNRWLSSHEFGPILSRCHAVVVAHTGASQSGIVAAALGAGTPVVVTPVGGLLEQIQDGITGMIAASTDAPALAQAIRRLLDPALYQVICSNIARTAGERTMGRFVCSCVTRAMEVGSVRGGTSAQGWVAQ